MKSFALLAAVVSCVQGFSLMSPQSSFPGRFGQYLKEIDEMFDNDWPATYAEKQLEEFQDSLAELASSKKLKKAEQDTSMQPSMTFRRASPRYEVMEHPDKFEVMVHVPGYDPKEVEIEIKAGGRLLSVTGMHKEIAGNSSMSRKFQQNFSLDPSIMTEKLTAEFQDDDMLILTAPRHVDRLPESRKISIKGVSEKKQEAEKKGKKHKDQRKSDDVRA